MPLYTVLFAHVATCSTKVEAPDPHTAIDLAEPDDRYDIADHFGVTVLGPDGEPELEENELVHTVKLDAAVAWLKELGVPEPAIRRRLNL